MPIRSNIEEVLRKCKEVHGDVYDYRLCTTYENQRTKLPVICNVHGVFYPTAGNHLVGRGCQKCGYERSKQKQGHSVEKWIEDCILVHSNKYSYEDCGEYVNNLSTMKITCQKHGSFSLLAVNHKAGQGCKKCAHEKLSSMFSRGLSSWIQECTLIHGGRYDYSECLEYRNQTSEMPIVCKDHGVFYQSAAAHIRGQDCPSCAKSGFNPKAPAYVYVLQDEDVVKIGITNRLPNDRLKQVNKDSGKDFHVYYSVLFEFGSQAYKVEQYILKDLRNKYEQPRETFDGCKECFLYLNPEHLKHLIEQRIREMSLGNTPNNEQNSSQNLLTTA